MAHISDKKLDELLEQTEFLQIPDDFDKQVLTAINTENNQEKVGREAVNSYWAWLALIGGSVLGLSQSLTYILSVWLTVNAH